MDKEYIMKHNLMEAHKQFMRLSEGYLATSMVEDDNEQENMPDDMNNANNNAPADMSQDMNNEPEQPQQTPDMNNAPQEDMPDMGNAPEQQPMSDMNTPEMNDLDMDTEEDDVLDVEDLTQAQEKLNKKQNSLGHDLGEVDDRIIALLTAVEKIQGSLEKNNQDITALKSELEKRVPTDTEKLNMQSLKMYPFNVSPNEYWKDKERDGRYKAEEDEKEKEYKITRDDVDEYTDRDIENSFDDELNQTMKDIFKGF
jgi:uncharacterized protein YoxC